MINAVCSKYLASQELEDVTKEQSGENTDLASSSSSWPSSVSSTAYMDGVQVIGAMGGKGIEFHKSKGLNMINLANASLNDSLFTRHPQISLYNMSVDNFSSEDQPTLSLRGLQSMDLSSNFLSSWPRHVGPLLASSPDLQILNMSSNPIAHLITPESQDEAQIREFAKSAYEWLSKASQKSSAQIHIFQYSIASISAIELPSSALSNFLVPSPSLTTLVLNKTGITWKTFMSIISSLPSLQEAHGCLNNWTSLTPNEIRVDGRLLGNNSLKSLNLDSNMLFDFSNVAFAISSFPNLAKLIVSQNPISFVPEALALPPSHPFSRIPTEGVPENPWSISLSSTHIKDWASLRNLSNLVPQLSEIRWQRNPMHRLENDLPLALKQLVVGSAQPSSSKPAESPSQATASDSLCRQYVIAMCPHVKMVNGSAVSELEHQDAERLYLVHLFTALAPSLQQQAKADPKSCIEELSKSDTTLKRIWETQREATLDAFSRSLSISSTGGPGSSSGIAMLDITLADETGGFYLTKKLPASTTVAKIRSIATASFNPEQQTTFKYFDIFLMEPSSFGPPAFHPLTTDTSSIAQETSRLKVTLLIKPRRFKWVVEQ
jgi:hypothetical protein